ncbi:hypothetical protein L249_0904 [Ophiocordyceps polyrhachis-furcata BCC 54312]|uniref:Uncharacterized protein n=1 Tax=Ophiocordyceps polyrhachis-furcata BCC 54312 TaxID=1330021 RepID=A0A367LCQ4_9HYPO|nr:hypothetical protein L249_0904 [Ophiocordyceps polyrhachis-furcata BCC 54312]
MVSFFGIKLKESRKSLHASPQPSPGPSILTSRRKPQTQPRPQPVPPKTENKVPTQNQQPAFNFSRPQNQAARSVTSHSRKAAPESPSWRAVFGDAGASSSTADLPLPVMGNLRRNVSDLNLYASRAAHPSAASLPMPSLSGLRPGTPTRPSSRKADWVNPLDVHFCRNQSPSPLHHHAKQLDKNGDFGRDACPSPPHSDGNADRPFVPHHPSVGRVSLDSSGCNGQGALLRNVEAPSATLLPSPAPSSPVISDGGGQTTQATLQKKGFVGNFSDFDFGDCVLKSSVCAVGGGTDRPDRACSDAAPEAAVHGFSARVDSMAHCRRARPPRPLDARSTAESPSRSTDHTRRLVERPPSSPFSLQPMEGDFPVSGGLPRGRRPGQPSPPLTSGAGVEASKGETPGGPWPTFNRGDVRRSAVPPPLSMSSGRSPSGSGSSSSVGSASTQRTDSPILSFTNSSEDLVKSFEMALEESLGGCLFTSSAGVIGAGLVEPARRTGHI